MVSPWGLFFKFQSYSQGPPRRNAETYPRLSLFVVWIGVCVFTIVASEGSGSGSGLGTCVSQAFSVPGASLHSGVRLTLGHITGTSAQDWQLHHKGRAQVNACYILVSHRASSLLCPLHGWQELCPATDPPILYPRLPAVPPAFFLWIYLSHVFQPSPSPAALSPLHCSTFSPCALASDPHVLALLPNTSSLEDFLVPMVA